MFLRDYSVGLAINYTLIYKKKTTTTSFNVVLSMWVSLFVNSHKCFTKMMLSALYMLNNIRAVIKMPNCKSNKTLFSNNIEENCFLFTAWHVDFSSLGLSPFGWCTTHELVFSAPEWCKRSDATNSYTCCHYTDPNTR